jgi:hypothetical protein
MTKETTWFTKFDKLEYGMIGGVLSAVVGFLLNYFLNKHLFMSLLRYWETFKKIDFQIVSDMMTLALLLPMAVFYFTFFRADYQQFSRGLLIVILPIVIFIVYLQL